MSEASVREGRGESPRLLLIYDYFDPAYKAGGPIASCANLVALLGHDIAIDVFTSNRDLGGTVLDVEADRWTGYGASRVFYADRAWNASGVYRALREHGGGVVYLNGMFSMTGVFWPLVFRALRLLSFKAVLAPRGMLQPQALALKSLKKRCYLSIFRRLIKRENVRWHATSEEEKAEVKNVFPSVSGDSIRVVGNVPRSDFQARQDRVKNQPPRFVTIALISPMKNIHRIIEALAQVGKPAEYHLCGPVKDSAYWRECQERVKKLPAEVVFRYHGAIRRPQVEAALASCDFYVQPSRSENFGHSIFESLVAGVPAITSSTTPWTAIEKAKAGFIVDPDDQQGLLESLRGAIEMPPGVYAEYCSNARAFSRAYLRRTDFKNRYRELFKE